MITTLAATKTIVKNQSSSRPLSGHKPVLLEAVLEILKPEPGGFIIDGTLNGGGHALEILKKLSPGGTLLGIDWDNAALNNFQRGLEYCAAPLTRVILISENFKNTKKILKDQNLGKADGLILDLGFSSNQLEQSGRGFSFLKDEPLLMTFDAASKPAYEHLKDLKKDELCRVIRDFGEERFAGRIAEAIKKNLPVSTSAKLADVIRRAVPKHYEHGRIHPATRTFQALRIFVNHELDNIKTILEDIPKLLRKGGRVIVISFHSLEDRIVKHEFREMAAHGLIEILTKKPVVASDVEVRSNRRSRSAKLRAARIL